MSDEIEQLRDLNAELKEAKHNLEVRLNAELREVAAEIERLRAEKAKLLDALRDIAALSSVSYRAPQMAAAAIAKAEKP
jgi:hypothetical protein